MRYPNITKIQYENTCAKALELEKTEKVKRTASLSNNHYGIEKDEIIGLWHLIAIILYTDFSAHCSQFSSSFRRLTPFETLEVTKKRNAIFYWMARYLREVVEVFGERRNCGLKGPFYCGINRRMIIPEFNLRLSAPTSSTKQIEVALMFAGSDGMIVQMNNESSGYYDELRAFNVSYLSRFSSEDERLFIGGDQKNQSANHSVDQNQAKFYKFYRAVILFGCNDYCSFKL